MKFGIYCDTYTWHACAGRVLTLSGRPVWGWDVHLGYFSAPDYAQRRCLIIALGWLHICLPWFPPKRL